MLELQHPQSMPHAVAFDRPFNKLSCSKQDSVLLPPLPRATSRPSISSALNHTISTLTSSIPTPPSEMTLINGTSIPPYAQGVARAVDAAFTNSAGGQNGAQLGGIMNGGSTLRPLHDSSRPGSRPTSPSQRSRQPSQEAGHRRKVSNNEIAVHLQIPKSILTPQASMPQLAAEITCLFWFENSSTLQEILRPTSPRLNPSPLAPDAIPTTGFRKWVALVLSTTAVAQNVILLALLFIYRLKKSNPGVKGKPGSEYRLLTVALMLGNKFLDDNTYTNKTWADVSGISVQEVHVMEVEFLSNMRYGLFTSSKEWDEWHTLLGKFGTFFERAFKANQNLDLPPRMTPGLHMSPALPSPPTSQYAVSPPYVTSRSPTHPYLNNPPLLFPTVNSTVVSPVGNPPERNFPSANGRKRSHDEGAQEPPSKRPHLQYPANVMNSTSSSYAPTNGPTLPRLPNLSIPFTQSMQSSQPALAPPQLPAPGTRAMSMVYPSPAQWLPPTHSTGVSGAPMLPHVQPSAAPTPDSRQLSPFPLSAGASPNNLNFSRPDSRLSPSVHLAQRQSPYRPVRNVQTLLYPPPSASMHNPARHVSTEQMQYQPLGRPMAERRAGPLPYMQRDVWPENNQLNQWPVLPQPNFTRS